MRTFQEPFRGCKGVAKSAKETFAVKVRSVAGRQYAGDQRKNENHAPNTIQFLGYPPSCGVMLCFVPFDG